MDVVYAAGVNFAEHHNHNIIAPSSELTHRLRGARIAGIAEVAGISDPQPKPARRSMSRGLIFAGNAGRFFAAKPLYLRIFFCSRVGLSVDWIDIGPVCGPKWPRRRLRRPREWAAIPATSEIPVKALKPALAECAATGNRAPSGTAGGLSRVRERAPHHRTGFPSRYGRLLYECRGILM